MGGTSSRHQVKSTSGTSIDPSASNSTLNVTLDGKMNCMKMKTDTLKVKWKAEVPEITILASSIRIQDTQNNIIELHGDQENVEFGGFQMSTQCSQDPEGGRRTYSLGINTKLLNLATFEVEVQSDGNIVLRGRRLKNSWVGQLKLVTSPQVTPRDVQVDAVDNNRTIWIRVYYYETPEQPHNPVKDGRS